MQFERGIWVETARNFWTNKWLAALAVGIILAVTLLENVTKMKSSGGIWVEFAWLPLVIAAHSTVLNGQSGFSAMMGGATFKSVFSPFLWRSVGLSLVGAIPAAVIAIPLAGSGHETLFIYLFMAIYGAVESLILAKWGTMLPACVVEGDRTLAAAGKRGKIIFGYVLGRLWACNGPLMVAGFAILIGAYVAIQLLFGQSLGPAGSGAVDNFLYFFLFILFAFNLVMLATILSRAYLISDTEIKKAPAMASTS